PDPATTGSPANPSSQPAAPTNAAAAHTAQTTQVQMKPAGNPRNNADHSNTAPSAAKHPVSENDKASMSAKATSARQNSESHASGRHEVTTAASNKHTPTKTKDQVANKVQVGKAPSPKPAGAEQSS